MLRTVLFHRRRCGLPIHLPANKRTTRGRPLQAWLSVCDDFRPGFLEGERSDRRPSEIVAGKLLRRLWPLIPRRYRLKSGDGCSKTAHRRCGCRLAGSERHGGRRYCGSTCLATTVLMSRQVSRPACEMKSRLGAFPAAKATSKVAHEHLQRAGERRQTSAPLCIASTRSGARRSRCERGGSSNPQPMINSHLLIERPLLAPSGRS